MTYWKDIKEISAPEDEWITLDFARTHLRIAAEVNGVQQTHPDDSWIKGFGIPSVREVCEQFCGLSFVNRTVEIALDAFPAGSIELPFGPVSSVVSFKYLDEDGTETTLATDQYVLDTYSRYASVYRGFGITWPTPQVIANALKIRYITGYSEDTGRITLPMPLKMAMLLLLTHYFRNRSDTTELRLEDIPMGSKSLMRPYQTRRGMA